MNKIPLMKALFIFLFVSLSAACFAQPDTLSPAYKRYPTVPPLQLILEDSITKYTKADLPKKKPVLIMLFSPDCDHCKQEVQQFVANADALKNIHIVMITTYPLYRLKEFKAAQGLAGIKNIVVAKDPYYILPPFYDIRNYPFMALYDKKGDLLTTIEGSVTIEKLLDRFQNK